MKPKNTLIALILIVLTGITGALFYERFFSKAPKITFPDESRQQSYTCPTGTVNCMPGPRKIPEICNNEEYLEWAKENCPEFKGLVH